MKRILLTLILIVPIIVPAKDSIPSHDIELKNSLLWKISGKEITTPSYLYGTMHMVCDSKTADKPKVVDAISKSTQLYLELDMDDPNEIFKVMSLANKGKKVKDIKNEETKSKLLELAEQHLGIKAKLLKDSSLFNIMSMIAMKAFPVCDNSSMGSSVEQQLMAIFKLKNIEINGLETAKEQMFFINESGMMDAEVMLKSFEEFDDLLAMYKSMETIYYGEDISALFHLMSTPTDFSDLDDIEKILEVILRQRNQNWIEVIPSIAKEQVTFFAVGAGHLGGDIGVINLLREQGYTVEAVMDGF